MKRLHLPVVIALAVTAVPAAADEIDNIAALGQAQFKRISEDLSSALSYKAVTPVEPLGVTGFDIGIEATSTKLQNPDDFDAASSDGDAPESLIVPKLHIHKGLPFGIDIGAFYASVPSTGIKLTGAEIRYAFLEGGVAMPAIGIRGAFSKLSGVDELDLKSTSVELAISKGFTVFTPYAGIGRVTTTSTPKGDAATAGLDEEKITQSKSFIGMNINLVAINLDLEADKTGDATSYGFKFGWRF
jgi:hypothetical protein